MTCRCGEPTRDNATIGDTCRTQAVQALRELAELLPALTVTAAGMAKSAAPAGRIKGKGHGNGVNVHALDVADEVRAVVTPWVRAFVEERTLTGRRSPSETAALCGYLADCMSLIAQSESAPDFVGDLLEGGQSLVMRYNDDDEPDTGAHWPPPEFRLANRPPLVALVRQVVDTHRGGDGLPLSQLERAQAIADEWWTLADLMEILPALMPHGLAAPSLRTLERWAYGRPAAGGRQSQPARLLPQDGKVRVGSVMALLVPDEEEETAA